MFVKRYLQRLNLFTFMQLGYMYGYYGVYNMIVSQQKTLQGK